MGTATFRQGGATRLTTSRQYDFLNRPTSIASVPNSQLPSSISYAYAYNPANQRSRVTAADGSYWAYEYDALGQVKSGKRYWSDGTPVAGQQFEYGFDDIGNRTATKAGGDAQGQNLRSASYGANSLNQYTNRSVPGAADIVGAAYATATVTVNGNAAYRRGEYFQHALSVANAIGPVWQGVTNRAVLGTDTNTVTGSLLVPPATQNFFYDADGNLTNDAVWVYWWDGENRLAGMSNLTTVAEAGRRKLDFAYAHQGRRIEKVVSTWNGSAWAAQSTNRFVYDGWNLVAVLSSDLRPLTSFLWGSDLSGTPQGAGGVGGLLAVIDHANSRTNLVAYDGNGNVSALVDAADGTATAVYEYGPFGELIRASGSMALANSFRFSSKYQDDETGLLYYGYRYYAASTGRWLSQDPLEERGGANLYAFVGNNAVLFVDPLGLAWYDWHDDLAAWAQAQHAQFVAGMTATAADGNHWLMAGALNAVSEISALESLNSET
jgi:RHS repeat-associated protein